MKTHSQQPPKMATLQSDRKWLPVLWTAIALAITWIDYFSRPDIAFPYLFLVPVALAARYSGAFWGLAFAVLLPLGSVRFSFRLE
jgi:hypothetical protein